MLKRILRMLAAALLVGGLLGACGGDDDNSSGSGTATGTATGTGGTEASEVTIKTLEYSYGLEGRRFKGGLVELTIDNSAGKEPHEIDLVRLLDGKTLADYKAAGDAASAQPWVALAGGPGPVDPGKTAVYTGNLDPGNYILQCHVPAPDGKDHIEHGMQIEVEVTAGEEGSVPDGDLTIGAQEMSFTGLDGLKAGEQTVRVENQGQQPHHWGVAKLAPGKTVADLLTAFGPNAPPGPPPLIGFPGLVATLPPGGVAARTLELDSGTYALVCFIPDTDGVSHAAKGMAQEFTIS